MENNNRKMAHIRRVRHLMMPRCRDYFSFSFFSFR
ncbi:leader peptide SpeFL [Acerihabitans sp.]